MSSSTSRWRNATDGRSVIFFIVADEAPPVLSGLPLPEEGLSDCLQLGQLEADLLQVEGAAVLDLPHGERVHLHKGDVHQLPGEGRRQFSSACFIRWGLTEHDVTMFLIDLFICLTFLSWWCYCSVQEWRNGASAMNVLVDDRLKRDQMVKWPRNKVQLLYLESRTVRVKHLRYLKMAVDSCSFRNSSSLYLKRARAKRNMICAGKR